MPVVAAMSCSGRWALVSVGLSRCWVQLRRAAGRGGGRSGYGGRWSLLLVQRDGVGGRSAGYDEPWLAGERATVGLRVLDGRRSAGIRGSCGRAALERHGDRRLVVGSGASLSNITGPEKARWFDGAANLVGGGGPEKVRYLRRSWSAAVGLKRPDISGERRKPVAVGSTMGPGQVRSQWGDGAGPRWSGRVSAGSRRCCCFGSRQRSVSLGGIFPVFIPLGTKRGTALQRVLAPDWPVAWSTRGAWRTASSW